MWGVKCVAMLIPRSIFLISSSRSACVELSGPDSSELMLKTRPLSLGARLWFLPPALRFIDTEGGVKGGGLARVRVVDSGLRRAGVTGVERELCEGDSDPGTSPASVMSSQMGKSHGGSKAALGLRDRVRGTGTERERGLAGLGVCGMVTGLESLAGSGT